MSFRRYLERKYTTASVMQEAIHRDQEMVVMLASGPQDADLVRTWMREYGLFQGITTQDRNAVVKQFLHFAGQHERTDNQPSAADIEALFTELLTALHRQVPRSWVSASSKLLWCLYPQTVVIYDAFVHRALVAMQCLDDDLADFPRIGAAPRIGSEADIPLAVRHYMNYHAMVHQLFSVHRELLNDLRSKYGVTYPYDIRIIDKVLWMIGNPKQAY